MSAQGLSRHGEAHATAADYMQPHIQPASRAAGTKPACTRPYPRKELHSLQLFPRPAPAAAALLPNLVPMLLAPPTHTLCSSGPCVSISTSQSYLSLSTSPSASICTLHPAISSATAQLCAFSSSELNVSERCWAHYPKAALQLRPHNKLKKQRRGAVGKKTACSSGRQQPAAPSRQRGARRLLSAD